MAPPLPIALFPPAPNVNLVADAKLQSALQAAVTKVTIGGRRPPFGLTIVDLSTAMASAADYAFAGVNQDTEHYAASMLKAACLYAAHALLDLVQRFALARKPKDAEALFQMLVAEVNPHIEVCCPMITGRAPDVRLPRWRDVFTATGASGALNVQFTRGYTVSLEKMIVPSDNNEAGRCIRGVGYAYLNGLMLKHGFFDASSKKGIWLAGDYGGSHVVTIPCDNDVDTKQGTTSAAFAQLGVVMLVRRVLPSASHTAIIDLLEKSSHGVDSSFFTRPEITNHLSGTQVTHGKIGLGPLKSNRLVYSDINAISDPFGSGGRFIVCYTNVDNNPYAIDHVLWTFLETIRVYQAAGRAAAVPTATTAPAATARP